MLRKDHLPLPMPWGGSQTATEITAPQMAPTVKLDVFSLPEVGESGRVPESVLLGHQSVVDLDEADSVLGRLVVDHFHVFEHLGTLRVIYV